MHITTSGRRRPAAGAFARLILLFSLVAAAFVNGAPAAADAIGSAAYANGIQTQQAIGQLDSTRPVSLEDRCLREGENGFGVSSFTAASTAIAAGAQSGGGVTLAQIQLQQVGYVTLPDLIKYSASPGGVIQVATTADANTRFPSWIIQDSDPTKISGTISRPNFLLRGFTTVNATVTLTVRYNASGASTPYMATLSVDGCRLTDDFNYAAREVMVAYGDSTWAGTGPSVTHNMLPFLYRDWLRSSAGGAHDIRIILKAISGSTSSDHDLWRKGGWYDQTLNVTLGLYNLSINDTNCSTTTCLNTYSGNLANWWTWFHATYPKAKGIVFGTAPLNNGNEPAAVLYRPVAQAFVAGVNSPQLYYCNLGTAFPAATASYYSDGVTHAGDTGHAAEWATLQACIAAQNITIP